MEFSLTTIPQYLQFYSSNKAGCWEGGTHQTEYVIPIPDPPFQVTVIAKKSIIRVPHGQACKKWVTMLHY